MNDCFQLPSELNIYTAVETRDALTAWLAARQTRGVHDELRLSAKDVNEVDGAGLQIVAALSHASEGWCLVDASSPFLEACQTLGLSHWTQSLHSTAGKGAS